MSFPSFLFPASAACVYVNNWGRLYKYDSTHSKLTVLRTYRKPGYEEINPRKFTPKGMGGNSSKLERNIKRARSTIYELALCNSWAWFCTFTFDKEKVKDRYDLVSLMQTFRKWLSNYKYRNGLDSLHYLLIPERHKDGAWHLHGLFMGVPMKDLHQFSLSEKLPNRLRQRIRQGVPVYTWVPFSNRFGYVTLEPILSQERVSSYITKYITKELSSSVAELNARMFYASKGLRRKELVYSGAIHRAFTPDFQNEYVKIKNGRTLAEFFPLFAEPEPDEIIGGNENDPWYLDRPVDGVVQAWNH